MKKKNILSLDYGTKYVGMAYRNERSDMTMPLGTLYNDPSLLYNLGAVIQRYFIGTIVIGYPKQHKYLQNRIDELISQLPLLSVELTIIKTDEEYTSVQAAQALGSEHKSLAEDSVAAMYILEHYLEKSQI